MAPSSNMLWLFAVILGVYFLSLDIVLHYKIAGWDPAHPTKNEEEGYDMFNPLSVKLLMIDHASHFIYHPISELFDQITGFSLLFPFITPNFISFCHLSFALVSAKLIGNDNLCWRQIGVLFFEFRTYLDSLDGVVYRSHSKHSSYNSGWGTSGYFVDIACDILAGLALFVSICFYFYRHHPSNYQIDLCCRINDDPELAKRAPSSHYPSKKAVGITLTLYCVRFLLTAGLWDHYVHQYTDLLESPHINARQQLIQKEAFRSPVTGMIWWFWRIGNSSALLEQAMVAVFINKLWEYIRWTHYIGWVFLLTLVIASQIHTMEIQAALDSAAVMVTQHA